MDFHKVIVHYGVDVLDTETSPFEALNMLHTRSFLEENLDKLSVQDKLLLLEYDLLLIKNVEPMLKHVSKIYKFSISKYANNEWWWHLDKVADGSFDINFGISVNEEE